MELVKTHKSCSKCKVEKPLTDFGMRSAVKERHLYRSACFVCQSEMSRNYRTNNSEKVKQTNKESCKKNYEKNRESILAKSKTLEEKTKKNEWNRQNRIKNGDIIRQKQRDRWSNNTERNKELYKIRYDRDKDFINERQKRYRIEKPQLHSLYKKNSYQKIKENPLLKLAHNTRSRVTTAIRNMGYKKNSSIRNLIGIDYPLLKIYLETQFTKGMTWDNYGRWHVDHVLPLASAKNEQELLLLFHYTNLQPLWATENISKGAKIIEHQLKIAI